jgi:proline iminopeptidase
VEAYARRLATGDLHDRLLAARAWNDWESTLSRISAIGHIPTVFIHGRRDISGPAKTAWRLHQSWPASRLYIVETDGHGRPQSMEEMRVALNSFARER